MILRATSIIQPNNMNDPNMVQIYGKVKANYKEETTKLS